MQARRFRVLNREATGVAVRASKQPSYSGVPGSQPLFRTRTALKTSTASIDIWLKCPAAIRRCLLP
jgi:hypothetical protein